MNKADGRKSGADEALRPRYRTGAVARMLRMPAATLRIWERRYGIAAPATTASGHRQYSAADVQRLALIRQLTAVGHPIGSLASLEIEQLRGVASTHAAALTQASDPEQPKAAPCKLAVVGPGAEHRLARDDVRLRIDTAVRIAATFSSLADARGRASRARHDALIVFVDGLQASMLAEVQAAARALHAPVVAVVYSFATSAVTRAFAAAGIALVREPLDDAGLADWLESVLAAARERRAPAAADRSPAAPRLSVAPALHTERRYDDATLADFAGLSTTIACECPRHVAEIVMKLSHFEAYSMQCRNLDESDAALHTYLGDVAASARSMFESALERLAEAEQLVLPRRRSR